MGLLVVGLSSAILLLSILLVDMRFPNVALLGAAIFSSHVISENTTSQAFDAREATISSIHHALLSGQTTCLGVVSSFLARVPTINPDINAIISLNPQALSLASDLDSKLGNQNYTLPALFCIPILLKDNFDTADLPTTGASLRLADSKPTEDAPSVKAFKAAGAIVLGKTNLHELALEGISASSLGGQTINPYDSTRTPGGSSGGTGAAIAASLAVFGTGTDTVNSLRSPASANSLVSIRPSRGLVSRAGVIPISYTQDTIGPIGRSVEDIAIALNVMKSVGFDPVDNATALAPPAARAANYQSNLKTGSLSGKRIGILQGFYNTTSSPETDPVNTAMSSLHSSLTSAGAVLVPITSPLYNTTALLATVDVQQYEFREAMDAYLSSPSLRGDRPRTLQELYVSGSNGSDFLVLPSQYSYVNTALVSSTSNATTQTRPSYATVQQRIANLTLALHQTFAEQQLDAIVYPEQRNLVVKLGSPSQAGRNGILAAVTGFPVVAMPAGFSRRTAEAPEGVPIGFELLGRPFEEAALLQMAWAVERRMRVRRTPRLAKVVVPAEGVSSVPEVRPNRGNIPAQYPLGRLG
ncbi:aspartyl/glutamyl-tRNA(Asn/Gln) amidotransferase, A subunit [Sphaceloma murrayae]|uniref:Aspartyl/glutamyl-tRNA(Asn/Gln) amidotransferase, A subunit n=1 Tax=Sphaceloma murrayae TaxID=2082308 RepID=A0A2K1QYX0_9PEZI|nr:aspartyl/glutamyl-tRNA(Asn/Gln) amidotransferase, A subunit [Sphaceloma murrayae]